MARLLLTYDLTFASVQGCCSIALYGYSNYIADMTAATAVVVTVPDASAMDVMDGAPTSFAPRCLQVGFLCPRFLVFYSICCFKMSYPPKAPGALAGHMLLVQQARHISVFSLPPACLLDRLLSTLVNCVHVWTDNQ